jgi:2-polyprenyl-3-methyl-5-hydroxy-6-metoxy-1,4-benzoquinol methylase
MQKIYQKLYETTDYGNAKINRCPSFRHLNKYKKWLVNPICDLGCGRGDTVEYLRKQNYIIDGFDFVKLDNNMLIADITKPMDLRMYETVICFDVLEHLTDKEIEELFKNIKQCMYVIFSVSNTDSIDWGTKDLHINKKFLKEWDKVIKKDFKIIETIEINPNYKIYRCEVKNGI